MSEKPISPLRRRMIEDMTVRNFVECESAPKWDPFSSPGKHLISERKLVRGGVRIGADRDPAGGGLSRLDQRLMLKSAGVPLRC